MHAARIEIGNRQIPLEARGFKSKALENPSHSPRVEAPKAFNMDFYHWEADPSPTNGQLKRDVVSYLCEYRLNVPKFDYKLALCRDKSQKGDITLRDEERGESLLRKAERAIIEKKKNNLSSSREEAEYIGLQTLSKNISQAKSGDTVLWASPPGPKELGYGDYGFLFVGKVSKTNNGEADVSMSAIRIENPSMQQFNSVMSSLTGDKLNHNSPEQYLARPELVKQGLSQAEIDRALSRYFSFKTNPQHQQKLNSIITQMSPMIEDFIPIMRYGTKEEREKALHALENYALKLKSEPPKPLRGEKIIYQIPKIPHRLGDIIEIFGRYAPPKAAGSCGLSGETSRSNMPSSFNGNEVADLTYGSDRYGSRTFKCPSCGQTNIRPQGELLKSCQFCDSSEVAC